MAIDIVYEGSFAPGVDPYVHTDDHPFCPSAGCGCHEDQDAISEVNGYFQEGLISADDATRIVNGATI